jgi:hypothetical protein
VDEVIARGMAKSPADRYATCGEFAVAFRAALAGTVLVPVPGIAAPDSTAPDSPAPGSTVPDGAYDVTRGVSVLEPAEQATPVGLDLGMVTDPVTSSTRSRSSRLAGRRLAVVSATVATVLAAGGITAAVLAGSGAGEHATAASEPPTSTSSATRTPTPTPGTTFTPPAVTGLVKDAKSGLAYSRLSSPWANGCPAALSSRTTLTWTAGESAPDGHIAAIGGSHDLSAEACSGLLPGQYGYKGVPSLAPVAQQLATAFAGAYHPGLGHTFTQVTSKALPVSGRHAWEVGYRLDYPDAASLGLAFTSEDAVVVVIDRGSQLPPVVFFASVPGNLGATQAVALVSSLTLTLPKPAAPSGGAGTSPVNRGGGGNTGGNYNPTTNPTTKHPTANPTTKHPTTNPTTGGQTSPPPTFN